VPGGRRDGDEAAHAVPDDDRWATDAASLGGRHDLLGPALERVLGAVRTVAVPGQVDRDHTEVIAEAGRDVRPPVRMGAPAVHEDEPSVPVRPR